MLPAVTPRLSTAASWCSELTGPKRLFVGHVTAMNEEYASTGASDNIGRARGEQVTQGDVR